VYKFVDDTPGEIGTLVFSHDAKAMAPNGPPEAVNLS
jgi:hypothetical protein